MSLDGSTYIGATIDLNRRLRQHNGEIKGGARRTTMKVCAGDIWSRVCYVEGFPDWTAALQFEWRWKQLSRKKQYKNYTPIHRRMVALDELVTLNSSTSKAIPYKEWPLLLQICLEKIDNMTEIIKYNNYINEHVKFADTITEECGSSSSAKPI